MFEISNTKEGEERDTEREREREREKVGILLQKFCISWKCDATS